MGSEIAITVLPVAPVLEAVSKDGAQLCQEQLFKHVNKPGNGMVITIQVAT